VSALVDVGLVAAVDITGVVFASFIGSVSSGAEYELIFFLKTTFWRAKYKNNQREPGPSNRVTTMFPNHDFYIAGLFQDE